MSLSHFLPYKQYDIFNDMMRIFDKLTDDVLEKYLPDAIKGSIFTKLVVNKKNLIINIRNSKYHVTIFRDQWNDYGPNEKLFHLTNEVTQCSIYFVFNGDMQVKEPGGFSYEQSEFGFNKSTRIRCDDTEIDKIMDIFSSIMKRIVDKFSNEKYLKYKSKYLNLKLLDKQSGFYLPAVNIAAK